jgi:hypothetical protein
MRNKEWEFIRNIHARKELLHDSIFRVLKTKDYLLIFLSVAHDGAVRFNRTKREVSRMFGGLLENLAITRGEKVRAP